MRYLWTSEVE